MIRFEPVTPWHALPLEELFRRNQDTAVTATFDPFPLDASEARRIALSNRLDGYFVAIEGDDLLAMSTLRGRDEGYAVPSFGIFVDHAHQGRGIGRALTVWTLERAFADGAPAVRLSVYDDNEAAIALYVSLGFAEVERDRLTSGREKLVMRMESPR